MNLNAGTSNPSVEPLGMPSWISCLAAAGRTLLHGLGPQPATPALVRDRAYEGQETRHLAVALGVTPVVPPARTDSPPGRTTGHSTHGATKSSACSDA